MTRGAVFDCADLVISRTALTGAERDQRDPLDGPPSCAARAEPR